VTGTVLLVVAKAAALAATSPSPAPVSARASNDNFVRPGWPGFIVFLLMAGAVALLLRSFVKQLKRIDFDEAATDRGPRRSKASPDGSDPPPPTATPDEGRQSQETRSGPSARAAGTSEPDGSA